MADAGAGLILDSNCFGKERAHRIRRQLREKALAHKVAELVSQGPECRWVAIATTGSTERKTGVKHAEVVTAQLVQDERGWLRLAG
jgi:hypothetical protein